MMRRDRYFVGIVFANLVVVLVHSVAHVALQILPPVPDTAFILGVILIGPVASLPLLRLHRGLAAGLLAVVMAASFAYGFWSHFLAAGPDHVLLSTSDPWWNVFAVTSIVLAALELAGVVVAAMVLASAARTP